MEEHLEKQQEDFYAYLMDAVEQTEGIVARYAFSTSTTVQGICGTFGTFKALMKRFGEIHDGSYQEKSPEELRAMFDDDITVDKLKQELTA